MIELLRASSTKRFLLFLAFLIATGLVVVLDVPFLRQFLVFLFFTIVPGLLILHVLKLNRLGLTEKLVLSVGLSISFSMFFGLLINGIYPVFGYETPLSTNSLVVSFSVILLMLAIIAYLRNRNAFFAKLSDFKLSIREKAFLLVPAFFPLLSILGMRLMNTTDNNVMLMVLLFLIPTYAILIAVKHRQVSERIYPPIIFLTSISLVLLLGLRSSHIIGIDAHYSYYIFQLTSNSQHWQIFMNSTLDACLSISLLPTIYQAFLSINPEYLFKLLYPLTLSISPLVVYVVSKKYIGNFYAFLASFFFIAQGVFLWTALNPRTTTAILFFALAIMVLFHPELGGSNKKLLFVIFAASCIVSHYSTAYIFFFVLLLTWVSMRIIPRIIPSRRKLTLSANSPGGDPPSSSSQSFKSQTVALEVPQWLKSNIGIYTALLFFVMLFIWYSQVTGAAFDAGVSFIFTTLKKLPEFFILASRGGEVESAFGFGLAGKGIPQKITFVFSWLTIAFIAIGVLITLARHRHMVAFPGSKKKEPPAFLNQKLDAEFFVLALTCSLVMVISVALPFVSIGYDISRISFQMMAVLSPFFVIGGIMIARFLRVRWAYLVILAALIPYLMCTTGTMYQICAVPQAITLNSQGTEYDLYYVHDQETRACRWLGNHMKPGERVYADFSGHDRVVSQGGIPISSTSNVVAFLERNKELDGYIYLRYYNVVDGKLIGPSPTEEHDLVEYQSEIMGENKIYANSGSEVWR